MLQLSAQDVSYRSMPAAMHYPTAAMLTCPLSQAATVTDGGLEKWPDAGSAFNIGIMLFRQGALPFAQVCAVFSFSSFDEG